MGGEKRRNFGGWWLGNLNWVLALWLFGLGLLFLHFPRWTGDASPTSAPQTAAILVGALWGSAALLLGAQINEQIRHRDQVRKNLQKAKNFNNILLAQFVNVYKDIELLVTFINVYIKTQDGKQIPVHLEIILRNSFLSHDFMYENLSLLEKHIGEIMNFHKSFEELRSYSIFYLYKSDSIINLVLADIIRGYLDIVFQSAVALAESMWPNEQIKIRGKTENLVEFLQKNLKNIRELKQPKS